MENLIKALKSYLYVVLNLRVKIRPWKKKDSLPFFLVDSYDFYEMPLFDQRCLLIVVKEDTEATPVTVRKHWEQVQKKWPGLCIFVKATITSYNRKRLMEHRVPFIIPGNQMYLPDLGIDLREYFRKSQASKKSFSPSTQAVMIYALTHAITEEYNPSVLAKELNYTLMTMSRAFDELRFADIGKVYRKGRERWWKFEGSKRELWEQAKPFLPNPVKNRVWVKGKQPKIRAGLTALSHYSMLNLPTTPVYAISMDEWKRWKESGIEEVPNPEDAAFELEIWHYNPSLFADKGFTDPLSLYLSMQEREDERIEAALEEMMEGIEW